MVCSAAGWRAFGVGWLCRLTALHLASGNGHTGTALALVGANADLGGIDNDGYGGAVSWAGG